MKILALLPALALLATAATARQNTTQRLKVNATQANSGVAASVYTDTIVSPAPHTVDINGYDKPLRSRREVFFVTNNATDTVAEIAYTINYYDTQRRMLHSISDRTPVEIPRGETRQVSKKSWDPQFNFYYVRSTPPQRTEKATPYEVTITVDTLFMR